jgi:hypothetical protein
VSTRDDACSSDYLFGTTPAECIGAATKRPPQRTYSAIPMAPAVSMILSNPTYLPETHRQAPTASVDMVVVAPDLATKGSIAARDQLFDRRARFGLSASMTASLIASG